MQPVQKLFRYLNSFSRRSKIIAALVLVVALFVLPHLFGGSATPEATQAQTHVTLASVASLGSAGGPLPVVGRVTSQSQATLTALLGGQIKSLPRKLGDRVAAGSVILSFENSSQQAAVLQAQGSYDAALAGKQAVSPADARAAALNTYRSSFTALDTTLTREIDLFFGAPGPYGPQLLIDAPMYSYGELSRDRARIRDEVNELRAEVASGGGSGDPAANLARAAVVVADVSAFAEKLSRAANARDSRASAAQLTAIASARSGLNTLTSSIAGATESYRAGSVSSTAATDAQVTTALGGLRAAQAALEKTYVRAPISGTIVSLPVNLGDFISPGSVVAVVSNPGALQVESYITSGDAKTLAIGGKATIEGSVVGTVVFIAPALDPLTGKIEIRVGLPQGQGGLVDGSSVSVSLERAGTQARATNAITIPLSSAKMTPSGPVVFTVASSTLVAHSVTFGPIIGGQVTITQGLTPDMAIVVDARGLSEGQTVAVDAQ